MDEIAPLALAILLTLTIAEILWSLIGKRGAYNVRETIANLGIALGNNLARPLSLAWKFFIFALIEPFQVYSLPATGWAFLLTFLATDCAYYWYHRLHHEVPVLWTLHHTHHSSPWYNLTTAVRLSWVGRFVSPVFFAPLVLLGMSPLWVAASLAIGLFYQFFLHTEAVPRLGRFEGKLLNTPSAHRVHHGSNARYIDRNYAGALIVWDRLFGTYEPEDDKVRYGVTSGFVGHNPLVIQFGPLWKYLTGEWRRERDQVDAGCSNRADT